VIKCQIYQKIVLSGILAVHLYARLRIKSKILTIFGILDEEICTRHKNQFIKTQKKIKKKARDVDRYFTFEMLKRDCVVKGGIFGLDPDKDEEPQFKKWLKLHPPKRQISDEERKIKSVRFKEVMLRKNFKKTRSST